MSRFTRLAALAVLIVTVPACMPVALSVGQAFPSDDAELEPMYGVHLRSVGAAGNLSENVGMDMKVHLIEYEPSMNAILTYTVAEPFYVYGGGGFVNSGVDQGDIIAMGEVGAGFDFPLMVNRYREGAYLFVEGGYISFAREETDGIGGPAIRAGLMYVP